MTYTYEFCVPAALYREVQYFNTFMRRRGQGVFVLAVFVGALALLAANTIGGVAMSNVMQMCYIVCLVALPLCVFACEQNTHRYRDDGSDRVIRSVSLSEEWIKFRVSGNPRSEKLLWEQVSMVFETRSAFIICRDADRYVAVPKEAVGEADLDGLRALFRQKLGRSFHER